MMKDDIVRLHEAGFYYDERSRCWREKDGTRFMSDLYWQSLGLEGRRAFFRRYFPEEESSSNRVT